MRNQLLRGSRHLSRLTSPTSVSPNLSLQRYASTGARQAFGGRPAHHAPADWGQPLRHIGRALQLYVPVAGVVLFWPYPVYKISEAIW
ncbi:hypothetical protein QBC33DRAFT_525587 [Phialemonium atrogriseum]|uniref:Uncharacterized protein n=1 Tax=Phialemonium atrogriseum TaxID=1093897 RepID=A0AAJ0C8F3_9PEZI|nr:uncharacterized protein QBC33DRAFT_525587 [Phialemonium atrogriseum]KAK1772074.1 hypothetical protein QBC33DRAFT_525587 [Phialemonium atrogriseum]